MFFLERSVRFITHEGGNYFLKFTGDRGSIPPGAKRVRDEAEKCSDFFLLGNVSLVGAFANHVSLVPYAIISRAQLFNFTGFILKGNHHISPRTRLSVVFPSCHFTPIVRQCREKTNERAR